MLLILMIATMDWLVNMAERHIVLDSGLRVRGLVVLLVVVAAVSTSLASRVKQTTSKIGVHVNWPLSIAMYRLNQVLKKEK
jgi:hypothetical protein